LTNNTLDCHFAGLVLTDERLETLENHA